MSGRLLRLVCTAAVAAGIVLAPVSAAAEPEPGATGTGTGTGAAEPGEAGTGTAGTGTDGTGTGTGSGAGGAGGERSVSGLLTDLQRLYREAEEATETYNATEERLAAQRAEVRRLDAELARSRGTLRDSRGAAGRLARQQYQNSSNLSPYLRLLLARDPQHALDQGHVIGRLSRERAETVGRLAGDAKKAAELSERARRALVSQRALAERRERERDGVRERLGAVEELLAALTPAELAALAEFEQDGIDEAQDRFLASGALGDDGKPSAEGEGAVRFAVEQLGKPYEWGAEGPASFDCSGLTSVAWERAGTPIPRTSQEQWARLEHVPLGELRPGDLVVYFPEATHVAMYLGDGLVVQAPRPGADVKVSPIAANPVLGAVRPDPGGEPVRRYTPPRLPEGAAQGPDTGYAAAYAPAAPETSIR
ncbi:NlpC/P60 family protein [Streptomyces sp. CT1-17]|uniref:C40 family peptidase n=1 Tax=Streptomyces sp. CT1-17 TaxID=2885642 RepID=UPI001D120447|nr:C40 family peptidase [Streptomyces sp. CT1-17]MCC2265487.1 NlpC/P60 family protein [Streptomyces sp. CT1-17]